MIVKVLFHVWVKILIVEVIKLDMLNNYVVTKLKYVGGNFWKIHRCSLLIPYVILHIISKVYNNIIKVSNFVHKIMETIIFTNKSITFPHTNKFLFN